jgi:hypothetical protein
LKRADDEDLEWKHAVSIISKYLVNADDRFLLESLFTIVREELSSLLTWVQDFRMLLELLEEAEIKIPKYLSYELFIGQVSTPEVQTGRFGLPKTHDERTSFSFEKIEKEVTKLNREKIPKFHQKNVRSHTRKLLMPPDMKRDNTDVVDHKYCRDCKQKHASGAHAKEDQKRYTACKAKTAEKGTESTNKTLAVKPATKTVQEKPQTGIPRAKGKCYQCGKVYFLLCPKVQGKRGPCFKCGKVHFPYCKITIKQEVRVIESQPEEQAGTGPIESAILARMHELFMIRNSGNKRSDICRITMEVVDATDKNEQD